MEVQSEQPADEGPAVTAQAVYATLVAAGDASASVRVAAQQQLQTWEQDAVPGFIGSLLQVVAEVSFIPEDMRLFAAVVAKNAVGSSWRKTMGTREWSRVPDLEKEAVRRATLRSLLCDPSERVALQLSLLASNLARFDAPDPWQALLPDLLAAAEQAFVPGGAAALGASLGAAPAPTLGPRALKALKHSLRALRSKRFVLPGAESVCLMSEEDLLRASERVDCERELLAQQGKALLAALQPLWMRAVFELGRAGEESAPATPPSDPDLWGPSATAALGAVRECLALLGDLEGAQESLDALLKEGAVAAENLAQLLYGQSAQVAASSSPACRHWRERCWERLLQCALVALDRFPLHFAVHLPDWTRRVAPHTLLLAQPGAVRASRPKARVLLTRLAARALVQPLYRREFVRQQARELELLQGALQRRAQERLPSLQRACVALDALVEVEGGDGEGEEAPLVGSASTSSSAFPPYYYPPMGAALTQAILTKCLALSPEELEEWRDDPEGFARVVDVETSPDADTPRPCGVALLECMLERAGGGALAAHLVSLSFASRRAEVRSEADLLLKEATYRAVGECFSHLRGGVNFEAWFRGELADVLRVADSPVALPRAVLQARALWLLGVCGEELGVGAWTEAYALCVSQARSGDLVVALMAVAAATAMLAQALEEQHHVQQLRRHEELLRRKRAVLAGQGEEEEDEEEEWEWEEEEEDGGKQPWTRAPVRGLRGRRGGRRRGFEASRRRGRHVSSEDLPPRQPPSMLAAMGEHGRAVAEAQSLAAAQEEAEQALHSGAAAEGARDLLEACFALLGRVQDPESAVRVLQCVSALVELLGARLDRHLDIVAAALPRVWGALQGGQGGKEGVEFSFSNPSAAVPTPSSPSGAHARLQSALVSALAHLVSKLGGAAMAQPALGALLPPLLLLATDASAPGAEALLDDGLRLWSALLQHTPAPLPPALLDLASRRLEGLLCRGGAGSGALRLAEAHALRGGWLALGPAAWALPAVCCAALQEVERALEAGRDAAKPRAALLPGEFLASFLAGGAGGALSGDGSAARSGAALAPEAVAGAHAALALVETLLKLPGQLPEELGGGSPLALLHPFFKVAARVAALQVGTGLWRLPGRGWGVVEACLALLSRVVWLSYQPGTGPGGAHPAGRDPADAIPVIFAADAEAQARLLDRWGTLASAHDLGELFLPALGASCRARRHDAAVGLCALLCRRALAPLADAGRAAKILALGLRVVRETPQFRKDLQALVEGGGGEQPLGDLLAARRLELKRSDGLAAADIADVLRAAAREVCDWLGEAALHDSLENIDPVYCQQLRAVMGGGEEADMLAALEAMHVQGEGASGPAPGRG